MTIFRRPKLSGDNQSSSDFLLRDALSQYGLTISANDSMRTLVSLNMDDIDFLESLQLIEEVIGPVIDKKSMQPAMQLDEVVALIDEARSGKSC